MLTLRIEDMDERGFSTIPFSERLTQCPYFVRHANIHQTDQSCKNTPGFDILVTVPQGRGMGGWADIDNC